MTSLAAVGIVAATSACGDDDAEVFGGATIPAIDVATTATDTTSPVSTDAPSDTSTTVASTSAPTTTAAPDTVLGAFPAGGELVVDFTFAPVSSGERIRNPYIAVWIEDLDGNLVDTVSVWWDETGRGGARWLDTLRQWSDITGEVVDPTTSGATRPAGTYSVGWDGVDADGEAIAAGSYRLFVEAAREDGPYEITSADLTFDGNTFEVSLADDGELVGVSARLVA